MQKLIIQRLLFAIPTLFIVSILSFAIMKAAPGDPVRMFVSTEMAKGSTEDIERIRHNLGLDRPVTVQYWSWLKNTLKGNLGYSLVNKRDVAEVIMEKLPASLSLMGISFVISITIGIVVGMISAVKQYSFFDYAITILAFIGNSFPTFWIAMMLIWLFAVRLGWLPTGQMSSYQPTTSKFVDYVRHFILPVFATSVINLVSWVRYQRASMLDVLQQDYLRTARAKGLKERVVLLRHAWRNALIPVLTLVGFSIANLVSGSYILETIFSWPGMGQFGFSALLDRDYPVLMGITLLSSIFIIGGNLLSDIAYILVDPRTRNN